MVLRDFERCFRLMLKFFQTVLDASTSFLYFVAAFSCLQTQGFWSCKGKGLGVSIQSAGIVVLVSSVSFGRAPPSVSALSSSTSVRDDLLFQNSHRMRLPEMSLWYQVFR